MGVNIDSLKYSFMQNDCLSSISTYYTCTGPNISNTIQLYCSRHADSTFCPIKIMEESTRRTSAGPLCSTQSYPNTSCNSNCEDYRLLILICSVHIITMDSKEAAITSSILRYSTPAPDAGSHGPSSVTLQELKNDTPLDAV